MNDLSVPLLAHGFLGLGFTFNYNRSVLIGGEKVFHDLTLDWVAGPWGGTKELWSNS